MKSEHQHRTDICRFGKLLHERGYVAATDGNLSVLLDADTILCTPTMICKGMMEPEDLVMVDMSGRHVSGSRKVSSEIAMHLRVYNLRADVHGIVHALGCVPLAPYATPGTAELTQALEPLVPSHDAILMANHGVVSYGSDLLQAYMKMETVEHFACIALVTHLLGRQQLLSGEDVRKLMAAREKYGITTPGGGCPTDVQAQSPAASMAETEGPEGFSVTREELMSILKNIVRTG